MCGISGISSRAPEAVNAMTARLKHRGPDHSGTYVDDAISLGHTLLSIRDEPIVSHQPVVKEGSPWILLFNGQIYNTKSLKADLGPGANNVVLDTALLYQTIEKYGWGFVNRIQGMFAIALYNLDERVVRLYRDASGQKHLYFSHHGGQFMFASEIKPLLAQGVEKSVDSEAVMMAAAIGYIPDSATIFSRIRKLQPSEVVTFDLEMSELSQGWFKPLIREDYPLDIGNAIDQVVEEHLQSRVPVALNLSGGIDSSLLLHKAVAAGHQVACYTTSFVLPSGAAPNNYNSDFALAKRLSGDYGVVHHEVSVTAETYLENLVRSYGCIEEPNYNISVPIYHHMAAVQGSNGDGCRVVLSGDGGDETFGGYTYYQHAQEISRLSQIMGARLFNRIKNRRNGTAYDFRDPVQVWLFFKRLSTFLLTDIDPAWVGDRLRNGALKGQSHSFKNSTAIRQMMMADRSTWLPAENFVRSDKLFMSQSIELRCPFAHAPFRDQIDRQMVRRDYASGGFNKARLREYCAGRLPDYITQRPDKTGWRAPVVHWYGPAYKKAFLDIISGQETSRRLVDWKAVKRRIEHSEEWPGKAIHLYLSLAILCERFGIEI